MAVELRNNLSSHAEIPLPSTLAFDYPTPAARPLNSRLDCATLEAVFGIAQPDWTQGLAEILKDLGEAS